MTMSGDRRPMDEEREEEEQASAMPELPRELKRMIRSMVFKRLTNHTDVVRFRAVCRSWRGLVRAPPPPRVVPFPIKLPHPITPDSVPSLYPPRRGYFNLSLSSFYLIFPCPPPVCQNAPLTGRPGCWLARFESAPSGKLRILNPFTGLPPQNLPPRFPRLLQSLDFGVLELSRVYSVNFISQSRRRNDADPTIGVYKAVVISDRVMVLYNQGDLAYIKVGSTRWKVSYDYTGDLDNDQSCYDDLIVFRRKFCVVSRTGMTLLIDQNAKSAVEIAHPICRRHGTNPKSLLILSGELYMVERDLRAYSSKLSREGGTGRLIASGLPTTTAVKFRVYKLSEEEKEWREVNDLGDYALFVGYDCSFGFSTRFLPPGCTPKPNCVYFADHCDTYNSSFHQGEHAHVLRELGCPEAGVFDLKDGSVKPLSSTPQPVALFWPPPAWLHPPPSSA